MINGYNLLFFESIRTRARDFPDFQFTHREEYPACDATCIFGELGGNLGLFLGGSILLGLDLLLEYAAKITRMCAVHMSLQLCM